MNGPLLQPLSIGPASPFESCALKNGFNEESDGKEVVRSFFFNPTLRQNSTNVTSWHMQLKNSEDR